jgi:hypothetical protein
MVTSAAILPNIDTPSSHSYWQMTDFISEAENFRLQLGRLTLSTLVFFSYSLGLFSVLRQRKLRAGLDGQAYFTMLAFFASTGVNLVYSVADMLITDNELLFLVEIPLKVGDFVIIAVFYKFVYEMRAVRLKLECEEYQEYRDRLRRQRIIWSLIYATLIINLALEFLFSLVQKRKELRFSFVGVVGLAGQVL